MVNFLLGQQGGHTKKTCFLCYWESRANEEHWIKEWPQRNTTKPEEKNIITLTTPRLIEKKHNFTASAHQTWINEAMY